MDTPSAETRTGTSASIEDLYRIETKAEIVDGKLVSLSPTGGAPGFAADEIFVSLRGHSRRTGWTMPVDDLFE